LRHVTTRSLRRRRTSVASRSRPRDRPDCPTPRHRTRFAPGCSVHSATATLPSRRPSAITDILRFLRPRSHSEGRATDFRTPKHAGSSGLFPFAASTAGHHVVPPCFVTDPLDTRPFAAHPVPLPRNVSLAGSVPAPSDADVPRPSARRYTHTCRLVSVGGKENQQSLLFLCPFQRRSWIRGRRGGLRPADTPGSCTRRHVRTAPWSERFIQDTAVREKEQGKRARERGLEQRQTRATIGIIRFLTCPSKDQARPRACTTIHT